MKKFLLGVIFLLLPCQLLAQSLSESQAIEIAKKFVIENGYTDANESAVKLNLDHESIERSSLRDEILKTRFNTLKSEPIGAKKGTRWSIAFDFVKPHVFDTKKLTCREKPTCRVVTMNVDGSDIRVEHQDGFRNYFKGFSKDVREPTSSIEK